MTRTSIDPVTDDSVIDEVRAIRRRISARFDHDPARLVAYYAELQERHRDRLAEARDDADPSDQSAA